MSQGETDGASDTLPSSRLCAEYYLQVAADFAMRAQCHDNMCDASRARDNAEVASKEWFELKWSGSPDYDEVAHANCLAIYMRMVRLQYRLKETMKSKKLRKLAKRSLVKFPRTSDVDGEAFRAHVLASILANYNHDRDLRSNLSRALKRVNPETV